MKLSDLIKSLIEVAIDYGECDVYLTTENETQLYNTALISPIPNLTRDNITLKIEGIINKEENDDD